MTGNWLTQSIVATMLLVPSWLAIGFFSKNYGVRPEAFVIWYYLGVVMTSFLLAGSADEVIPSWTAAGAILFFGLTIGAAANLLLFRAVSGAPNPGLPVAISNTASVGVFFAAVLLYRLVPRYFDSVTLDKQSLAGAALTIIGLALMVIKR